ncbi:OmpH family outer membrane protein [Desulfovibrio oxyclinae]|jgi:outer membrane protein|uniref:OmpH family outer membrane protein n=1 Tax=Desulfovibrio oxyclinae TaxID=63560 RepID=UPI00037718BD|nr:OmpH family outer membrane protein [Desulfovibrio oxyclinae]
MKRFASALCALVLLLGLTACNQQQKADSLKIGVVDETVAFQSNSATSEAMAYLQKKGEGLQAEAREAYEAMQADENQETTARYKQAMGKLQQSMGKEQQRIFGKLNDAFVKELEAYRQEKGLDIILPKQSALSMSPELDVTEEVTERMNKVQIDFDAMPEAEQDAEAESN